jgi:predicted XRE-type DNA-binding protein
VTGPWVVVATDEFEEWTTYLKSTFAKLEKNDMATKNFYELPVVLEMYKSPDFEKDMEEVSEEAWQEIVAHYVNLNRRRRKITQKQIAEALHISQPGVCQMLKRPATISKLWRLSVAMGGKLEVNIRFGDKVYSLLNEPLPGSEEE